LLANESLKPSKLIRHLDTKHSNFKEKPINYFDDFNFNFDLFSYESTSTME